MTRLPQLIETERCKMRPFRASDREDLFRLYSDRRVMEIRKIGVQDRTQAAAQLDKIVGEWGRLGLGLYAVFRISDREFIGECGLRPYRAGNRDPLELSYGLSPDVWGMGLATELASAVLNAGFSHLPDEYVLGLAKAQNAASARVLSKLGFQADATFNDGAGTVVRMTLSRANWSGGSRGTA